MGTGGAASVAAAAAMTAYATHDDLPEDLSTSKRASDGLASGGGKPTDHSIATIMKCTTGGDSCDADDGGTCVDRKKQRVEDIVHSIYPRLPGGHGSASAGAGATAEWRRRKNARRKQMQPQQHGAVDGSGLLVAAAAVGRSPSTDPEDDDLGSRYNDVADYSAEAAGADADADGAGDDDDEKAALRRQLRAANEQLRDLRRRMRDLRDKQGAGTDAATSAPADGLSRGGGAAAAEVAPLDWGRLLALIRSEIQSAVSEAVANSLEAGFTCGAAAAASASGGQSVDVGARQQPRSLRAATGLGSPFVDVSCNRHGSESIDTAAAADELPSTDDGLAKHLQKERRKRTKVTDTRLSPRAARALMAEVKPVEADRQLAGYPTQLLALNEGLPPVYRVPIKSDAVGRSVSSAASHDDDDDDIGDGGDVVRRRQQQQQQQADSSDDNDDSLDAQARLQTSTLTPLHLRKAKLMFFYVRYPSSALLKAYFPDVRFNKNNTAQLVKWFSNFREFYYIQMEKYARQLSAEGQTAEDVSVTLDSELYKVLNLHYNRSNQIEVPRSFRTVVQSTLKEFVRAILLGRDQEQSWKKPIYKVIVRMDDVVPDFFKSVKWMEQLTD